MPCLLIIDASSSLCSVAINHAGETVWVTEDQPRRHAQRLLPMIDELLSDAGIERAQIDGIAFGCGPGSFTGIRIATAVAQGMSLGLDRPVVGISSLAAVALAVMQETGADHVMSVMDAHMGEVFWGRFVRDGNICQLDGEERVGSPDDCIKDIKAFEGIIAGDGLQLMPFVECDQDFAMVRPEARNLSALAMHYWDQGKFGDCTDHAPVYLRQSVAWKKLDEQPSLLKR